MAGELKGDSPFYPGQPIPAELFIGREKEIAYILERGVGQTSRGKPTAFFVQGEYGIGKSSIASYLQLRAERDPGLLGVYATLGSCKDLQELASAILAAVIRSGIYDPTWRETIRDWLSKYVGKQDLFGFKLNLDAIRADAPQLASASQLLDFLKETLTRYQKVRTGKGLFLVFDEINGLAKNPDFAFFLKSFIDTNAITGRPPLPVLLMLCGVEERRRELIRSHQPVDRLFDVIDIAPMNDEEVTRFFHDAFASVGMPVAAMAMSQLVRASAGQPKIMHLVGDCTYWRAASEHEVSPAAASYGVRDAAIEVGKRFVDSQVLAAMQSKDYQSILKKLARDLGSRGEEFTRKDLVAKLSPSERGKLDNFLQKMKSLNVIKPSQTRGSYQFRIKMVQMYIWLHSVGAISAR